MRLSISMLRLPNWRVIIMSKKRKTSNLVLLAIGIFLLTFIISMEVIFCIKGSVPDVLIQYTLGAGGVEVFLLAAIKISKVVVGEKVDLKREDDICG
jgi:hypothetical protein